jgi:hypothetical protein
MRGAALWWITDEMGRSGHVAGNRGLAGEAGEAGGREEGEEGA